MDFYTSENSEEWFFFYKLFLKKLCLSSFMKSPIITWIYNFMHV